MNPPLLTVLICTHNRAPLLGQLLDSLDAAKRPDEGVELLVIANHCSDETHAMLDARVAAPNERLPLRWIAEPTAGKSHALNRGMPEVRTALVAFIDDDQRVAADFLLAVRDAARDHPEADLFCGRLTPDWTGTEPPWVHDQGRYRIYPLPTPNFDLGTEPRTLAAGGPLPGGGNIVARSPWLAKVGPFATDLGPVGHDLGGAEDAEWLRRALDAGATLLYVPAMWQLHYVDAERLTVGYLMHKAYKRSAASIGLQAAGPSRVPAYAYRKLAGYAWHALTALGADRRRFYLIRSAAALGEIAGHRGAGR
jgi:glycosyltransferase involved in cell wall biosynthesis